MHYAAFNRATVRVADTRDISGRLTADSINDDAPTQTKSGLWRACGLTIFCSVASIGVLASLTPVSAFADPGGIPAEIAELKAEVAALQSQVHALQTQLAAIKSNNALKLGPFVDVDPNPENGVRGPNITFKGANIHIVSGLNATDDNGSPSGLGNLIIGYDELLPNQVVVRGGSHNLVIGRFNSFAPGAFGGLVAGEQNTISNEAASVSAGIDNTASGRLSSVSGGAFNTASGQISSVSGGETNTASGDFSSVSGGELNAATNFASSVSGGEFNTATGLVSSVSGGEGNNASGVFSSVSGGQSNTASGTWSSVLGGNGITVNTGNGHFP
jgi:hypothetical protein